MSKLNIANVVILLGGVGFLVLAQNGGEKMADYPDPRNYAPNFWFDSEEKYYPTNPLDFYYDENLNELSGQEAKVAYDGLSEEEKLENFKVYYNVEDSGDELVYQYWLFYVFNDSKNEHYGDWESVSVFVDGISQNVDKVVASAHNGTEMKATIANNELSLPGFDNTTILVELGSHANATDGNSDGLFNNINLFKKSKDVTNWYNAYGIWTWSEDDKLHGLKVPHDSPYYDLRPLDEVREVFGKKYSEERPLISKEKSSTLGMLPFKIGKSKKYALPIGGDPPENAWLKKEYTNPQEVVPLTPSRIAEAVGEWIKSGANTLANVGRAIAKPFGNMFSSGGDQSVNTAGLTASVGENFLASVNSPEEQESIIPTHPPSNSIVATNQEIGADVPSDTDFISNVPETIVLIEEEIVELADEAVGIVEEANEILSETADEIGEVAKQAIDEVEEAIAKVASAPKEDASTSADSKKQEETKPKVFRFNLPAPAGDPPPLSLSDPKPEEIEVESEIEVEPIDTGSPTSTSTSTSELPAYPIVINEIQTGDAEFVELYNLAETAIDLSDYYFAYYSSSKNDWTDPWRNKKFPDSAQISANGYYLIGLLDYPESAGNPNADWQAYSSAQLSNNAGTIAVFGVDPKSASSSQDAYESRADAVGWGEGVSLFEGTAVSAPDIGKSVSRDASHTDSDNNSQDFLENPSPSPINSSGMAYDPNFSTEPIWAMYQKDARHSGLSSLLGPAWNSSNEAVSAWEFQMKNSAGNNTGGESQSVIDYAGNIYIADGLGNLHAINADGAELWMFDPKNENDVGAGWTGSSPALSSDSQTAYFVYSDTDNFKFWLFAIDASDGDLEWKYSIDGYNDSFTSPVLDSAGNIYLATKLKIYSVSASGSELWSFSPYNDNSSWPIWTRMPAIGLEGGEEYIYTTAKITNGIGDQYIFKLDDDGNEVLKGQLSTAKNLFNGISIGADGVLYTGGYASYDSSGLYALDPADFSEIWYTSLNANVSGPLASFDSDGGAYIGTTGIYDTGAMWGLSATGTAVWAFSDGKVSHPSAVDGQDRVYFVADSNYVYARSKEGGELWKYELSDKPVGISIGDGVVYVVSEDGKVYAFR